ncbi:CbiX/SirB N-terminal domain-containing protein [Desulfosporosinus sp. OT]|uniref:sirohydrochlorin chelatase n=1 Tax=Desulfosporosinus sp. OT TaxID=913865 RepID=UPI000223A9F6|nr:CbiX/SirB N-terminal domain-containing protein [Desulfosporosinus sp. OT]EGW41832.1 cbiX family protein [Desulfosporosinus sp. OT]
MQTEIILVGHGSRSSEANQGLVEVANKVTHLLDRPVTPAFVSRGTPDLSSAIIVKILSGATHIIIMPLFLFRGMYVSTGIYEEIKDIKGQFPQVEIIVAKELGADDIIANLAYSRIKEAIGT